MEEVKECIERIKVIMGVGNGFVSYEQIGTIVEFYGLNEEQRKKLVQLLDSNGIHPIPEARFPRTDAKSDEISKKAVRYVITKEEREARFKKELALCLAAFERKPSLVKQYNEELMIIKKTIAEYGKESEQDSDRILARAVMKISNYRIREIRHRGWVCGTYMYRVKERFRRWISYMFAEEELSELINSCSEERELSAHHRNILLILLHNAPSVVLHPKMSEIFND